MSPRGGTPVLIWQDLPPALRLSDEAFAALMPRAHPPAPDHQRCLARARGDSGFADERGVPRHGGGRCAFFAGPPGLCGRHYNAASPATRQRAAQLMAEQRKDV